MKKYNLAVIGATGMVGRKVMKILEERNFPVNKFYPMASANSAGKKLTFCGKEYTVEELDEHSFDKNIDVAIFSAGGNTSKKFAPIAAKNGVIAVDNSNAWRMDPKVPLVVPEVNPEDLKSHNNIISNPNCSTIQAMVAIKPLHDAYKIRRIVFSTYQAVSGSGVQGYEDLEKGIEGKQNEFYPKPIAFNVLPHIDVFTENGYTMEEMKMIQETRKILHDDTIKITATTARVPVYYGHSESINIEFEKDYDLKNLIALLKNASGIVVKDDASIEHYPTAVEVEDKDEVFVGRIRRDFSVDSGVNLWVVADNIRKGAATNTVQIVEMLISQNLI